MSRCPDCSSRECVCLDPGDLKQRLQALEENTQGLMQREVDEERIQELERKFNQMWRRYHDVPVLKFKKLRPNAVLPAYKTDGAAGMDLSAVKFQTIYPGERAVVPTGLAAEIPPGYEVQVRARSGLAIKHGLAVLNGPATVDWDYRGEWGVILINHGDQPHEIEPGQRIAQAVVCRLEQASIEEVLGELSTTKRGAGGYGSTGS